MPTDTPVWFVTGCSTGFGHELAKLVLARGWACVVTARDKDKVAGLVADAGDRGLALGLDVTDPSQIDAAVAAAIDQFGRIDVLVNNAGYGYQSSIEEGDDAEIRAQFEANVFGLFAMTRAVLPGMRERRSGHVINVTSVAGLVGFPGSGYYAASKHAVEGFSDSLYAEGKPIGIHVTCVEPGPFRTDWAGRSLKQTPNRIEAYAPTAGKRLTGTSEGSGSQAGDPVRGAEAMIALTQMAEPPRHMVLGKWGIDAVTQKLKERLAEIEGRRPESEATDFPHTSGGKIKHVKFTPADADPDLPHYHTIAKVWDADTKSDLTTEIDTNHPFTGEKWEEAMYEYLCDIFEDVELVEWSDDGFA